ncbi:MAG: IS1182 family transposase [Bacteroidota bacterium]
MKFRNYEQSQIELLPSSLEELIPSNHIVRMIDMVVEQLDLEELYKSYSEEGQPGYHPKMLLKILLYGYTTGVRSSRKIAEKTKSDVYFMYLSAQQRPDFRTISDFRLTKRKYLESYFIQVLEICKEAGLYRLQHISVDGSKIKANASKKKTKEEDELIRYEEVVKSILRAADEADKKEDEIYGKDRGINELPSDIDSKQKLLENIKKAQEKLKSEKQKRINLTDSDARFMKTSDGGINICYNVQVAVDSDNQIITANDVSKEGNDNHLFANIYEKIKANTKKEPQEVTADAGYYSGETYLYLEKNSIDGYIPESRYEKERQKTVGTYDRKNFSYNKQKDIYTCPEGKEVVFDFNGMRNGVRYRVYQCRQCPSCNKQKECISKESGKYRQIFIYENDYFKDKMREKLSSPNGRRKISRRKAIVEPVFAQIKYIMGFNRFLLRGIEKVKTEFSLMCTAYNIKKLAALRVV